MQENVRARIRELLETISEQVSLLQEYKAPIPQIEFDLVLENVRTLYQELHILQRQNDPFDVPQRKEPAIAAPDPPPAPEKPKAAIRKETPAPRKVDKEPGIDLFAEEEPAFNIRLKEAREQSLPPRPEGADHLKALISINDKFILINELFDGNLREYNETIETLNGFKDRKQAMDFFDLVRYKNLWDPASTAFRKLQEVLEKKFG